MQFNTTRLIVSSMISILASAWAQEDFNDWEKQQLNKWGNYLEVNDKKFAEFLNNEWTEFKVLQGTPIKFSPKPDKIPVAKITNQQLKARQLNADKSKQIIKPPKRSTKKSLFIEKKLDQGSDQDKNEIIVHFFNTPLRFNYTSDLFIPLELPIREKSISNFWKNICTADYEYLLERITFHSKRIRLNDWGFCLLLYTVGKKIYKEDSNRATLFTWFLLLKTGYDVKMGYSDNNTYLLVTSSITLFQVPYSEIDEKRRYVFSFKANKKPTEKLYTYETDYPGADLSFNFIMENAPELLYKQKSRTLYFIYNHEKYRILCAYNQNIIDYYRNYPQTDLSAYFHNSLSFEAIESITKNFKPFLKGKSETEAVNILLHFVQKAFRYKTDEDQFGQEKYLFAEQTLSYSDSDCEDRCILFTNLITNLLGLETIGLKYPGHIATGIRFNTEIIVDQIIFNNKKYVICDPTYINADVGMTMPGLENENPIIIEIKNTNNQ
jgi:hypothetical protein